MPGIPILGRMPHSMKDSQVVWSGSLTAAPPQRAEILEPTKNGGYAVTGHGGTARTEQPTPPPATKAPPPKQKRAAAAKAKKAGRKAGPTPTTPEAQSRVLAETVVGSMVDRLKAEARRKGGMLALEDIERLSSDFQEKTVALQAVFQHSFEEYVKARERSSWEQARQFPFDRILVKTFSHLFADGMDLVNDPKAVSRRTLPGFLMGVNMMLGPEALEEYQERCRNLVGRAKDRFGDAFSWEKIYDHQDAKAVLVDAQITIAPHFLDLDRRSDWFINMINGHLAPYDGPPDSLAARWTMTEVSFFALLGALFADLKAALSDKKSAAILQGIHGEESMSLIGHVLRHIEAETRAAQKNAGL